MLTRRPRGFRAVAGGRYNDGPNGPSTPVLPPGSALHRTSFYTYLLLSLFGVVPLIVAFSLLVVHDLFQSVPLTAIVCGSGVGAVLVQAVVRWNAFRHMQTRDLNWYRDAYPGYVRGRRVRCVYCRAEDVRPRALPNPTHMREHYCGACGQVLYYSPAPSS